MSASKRPFGPFADVPTEDVHSAGFACLDCRQPVERIIKALPMMVPRLVFYGCRCGMAVVWSDENQPSGSRHWRHSVRLMQRCGVKVVIFNGNRPLKPDFISGVN